jgi:hypothetical protein
MRSNRPNWIGSLHARRVSAEFQTGKQRPWDILRRARAQVAGWPPVESGVNVRRSGTRREIGGLFIPPMTYYPAVIVSVDPEAATARIEATGKQIRFLHTAHNAIAPEARRVGAKGFISFPKAPPVFTPERVEQQTAA